MTGATPMPPEILARIIREQLLVETLPACLKLRLVSKRFNDEVLHAFIDGGVFDKRFFRYLFLYRVVDSRFALRYLETFVRNARKQGVRPAKDDLEHRRRRRLARSDTSSESSSNASDQDSEHSGHVFRAGSTRRTRKLQVLLTSAVVMLVTNTTSEHFLKCDGESPDARNTADDDQLWAYWTTHASNAIISLLGARDALVFAGPKSGLLREMQGETRHLIGKSAEFFAQIGAVSSQNFLLSCQRLEHFRIDHSRGRRWLKRLNASWQQFAWSSTQREKVWLEVLAACLIIAVKQGNSELFRYLIDSEPAIFTPAFTYIRFNQHNVAEQVIVSGRLDYLQQLADRGWCLADTDDNGHKLHDQYRKALTVALQLSPTLPERFEILRILLLMSREWQRDNNFRRLLSQAATDDDLPLAELMLTLLSDKPVKWSTEGAASFERNSRSFDGADVLDVAEMNGSSRIVSFLLQHRKHLISIVEESWSYINPRRAVGQIIRRGEPTSIEAFKEIVFAARDHYLGYYFSQAAANLSTEVLAILAEYVDPNVIVDEDDVIVIEEVHDSRRRHDDGGSIVQGYSVPRTVSPMATRSSSSSAYRVTGYFGSDTDVTQPTRGEFALASALRTLNWRNARFLIEQLGIKLTWGSVKGIDVGEMDETGMTALVELRKLLAEHGMDMETKIIYVPTFHPGQAASTTKHREHDVESVRSSSSRRSSSTAS